MKTLTEEQKSALTKLVETWLQENQILGAEELLEIELKVSKSPKVKISAIINLGQLLATPLADLNLFDRVYNALNNSNIQTVGELIRKTDSELLRYRNFGKKGLANVKEKLSEFGLGDKLGLDLPITQEEKDFYTTLPIDWAWWIGEDNGKLLRTAGFKILNDLLCVTEKECADRLGNNKDLLERVSRMLTHCRLSFKM